jgi:hypothetical protein
LTGLILTDFVGQFVASVGGHFKKRFRDGEERNEERKRLRKETT